MGDAGGRGNRNRFSQADVLRVLGDSHGAVRFVLDMGLLTAAGWRDLRFFHVLLRDHFAYERALSAIHSSDPHTRDTAAWALWQIPDGRPSTSSSEPSRTPTLTPEAAQRLLLAVPATSVRWMVSNSSCTMTRQ
jgi:hypothetical protein